MFFIKKKLYISPDFKTWSVRNGLALAAVGVKQGGLPYSEVSWHPGRNTSSSGK